VVSKSFRRKRFNTAKQFASYFGLVPRLHQSGNHQYYGRITKLGNPYVRWALVQTARRLARMDRNYKKKNLVALVWSEWLRPERRMLGFE